MQLKCSVCHKILESENPRQKICDSAECARIRSRQYYLKWKAAHPDRLKQHSHAQYERRKTKKIQPKYFRKAVPKAKIKYYCKYHGCKRQTARNGANRLYCQTHWDQLQEGCSSEYQEYLYMDGNLDDMEVRV